MVGLRTYAGVLAGESLSYADEVEGCYGVRPTYTDEAVFTAAHERLEELLPGDGTLAERHKRWEGSIRVPTDQVELVMGPVIEGPARGRAAWSSSRTERARPRDRREKPCWRSASTWVIRSRIAINVDLPMSAVELLHLAIQETYPGHHVERCCKEQLLVRGRGLVEETIVLVPAPQSLVAEGIAELAVSLLLEGEAGAGLAAVAHDAGVG